MYAAIIIFVMILTTAYVGWVLGLRKVYNN